MCLYPELIKNKKYTKNKKNGGIIPAVYDERLLYVAIGCGKCIECRKQKAREWQVRLSEEIKERKDGLFVTLTFSNESIKELNEVIKKENEKIEGYDMDNEIATLAIRRFLERWRKKYKYSPRHWLITELGGNNTENIHIHGILWPNSQQPAGIASLACNANLVREIQKTNSQNTTNADKMLKEEIEHIWAYGKIWIGTFVNSKTINYIVKYVSKTDEKHKGYKSKICTSAGIGKKYIENEIGDKKHNKYKENGETNEAYRTQNGTKLALPIYYRNKIYSEKEREKLWLEKLDKQERYVLGVKIDISGEDGEEKYRRALERAQKLNKELGYGEKGANWELDEYEKKKRNIMRETRMKRAKK